MTGREFGCKLTLLLFGAMAIFGFFGALLNVTNTGFRSAILRRQQRDTKADLVLISMGLHRYADDHGGKLPPMDTPDAAKAALVPAYVGFDNAFVRLGDSALHLPNPSFSGKALKSLKPDALLFCEAEFPQSGDSAPALPRAALQADGTVVLLSPAELRARGWH